MRIILRRDTVIDIPDPIAGIAKSMSTVGVMLVEQVKQRFATAGRSGNRRWRPKVFNDDRAILTGRTGRLLNSFAHMEDRLSATVFSDAKYAHVHQSGTRKYGGIVPTIRPVRARMLFIPLTDRAAASHRITGIVAAQRRKKLKLPRSYGSLRVANRGRKLKSGVFSALKRGAFINGQLMVWDPQKHKYVQGKPDFILLHKVDIPPRPMLPDSRIEQNKQASFVSEAMFK